MGMMEAPVAGAASVWRKAGRGAQLLAGLFLFGASVALMIRGELGLGPWDAFHVGLSGLTGLSVGMVIVGVGLVIVAATWTMGVRPGVATIANMVLVGTFVDLLLPVLPAAPGLVWPWVYLFGGIVLTGLSTGMYIGARLGEGPRDGLMMVLAERSGWPVRRVRTLIEASALLLGWLMGGVVGLGTVLYALGVGAATQWGLQLFGVTPRRRAPPPT